MKTNVKNLILSLLFSFVPIFFWIGASFGTNTYTASFVTMFIPISMYFAIRLFNRTMDSKNIRFIIIFSLVLVLYISLIQIPLFMNSVTLIDSINILRLVDIYLIFIKEISIGTLLSVSFMFLGVFIVIMKSKKHMSIKK